MSRKNGQDVQHFYLKPDISGLTTSMIIITDRRVYHFLLRSFKDCYMTMVEFEYPNSMPYNIKTDAMAERINARSNAFAGVDLRFLSFDYKMSYSIFRKPLWLPHRVYDDGRRTYIQMDDKVLHTQTPVLFNQRNERINYRVEKNLIIIDELVEKVTLRRGKEKVTIRKKNYVEPKSAVESEETAKEVQEETKKTGGQTEPGFEAGRLQPPRAVSGKRRRLGLAFQEEQATFQDSHRQKGSRAGEGTL